MCCNHYSLNPEVVKLVEQARQQRFIRNARRRMLYALQKANATANAETDNAIAQAIDGYSVVFATNGTITMSDVGLVQKERELVTA